MNQSPDREKLKKEITKTLRAVEKFKTLKSGGRMVWNSEYTKVEHILHLFDSYSSHQVATALEELYKKIEPVTYKKDGGHGWAVPSSYLLDLLPQEPKENK